jgi:hypothetical protein
MYGIHSLQYNIKPLDFVKIKIYLNRAQYNYELYRKTHKFTYKQQALYNISLLEQYMNVYDARYLYKIDVVKMKRDLT